MGKVYWVLAAMMIVLVFMPNNEVSGASLENPLVKDRPDELDSDIIGGNRDQDEEYDYDFLNRHPYGGNYPRGLRSMQRHERLMKRLRRYAVGDRQPPFPPAPED